MHMAVQIFNVEFRPCLQIKNNWSGSFEFFPLGTLITIQFMSERRKVKCAMKLIQSASLPKLFTLLFLVHLTLWWWFVAERSSPNPGES
jgi:hypothetical protein